MIIKNPKNTQTLITYKICILRKTATIIYFNKKTSINTLNIKEKYLFSQINFLFFKTMNMKKNFLLIILGLFTAITANAQAWDGTSEEWTNGEGTETNPYLIEKGSNLAYLAEKVNAGETYEGVYFKLANNLDMGKDQHKFSPIGHFDEYTSPDDPSVMIDDSKYFLGVFDGNNKTIDNIHIYFIDNVNLVGGTGLFACISGNAVIKNLTIGSNSIVEGTNATGTIVGAMTGGRIEKCVNKTQIKINTDFGQGGIVGAMYGGTISGCVNEADISGSTNVGGIAGFVDRGSLIENCYNKGNIAFSGFYAGGLVGYLTNGTLKNSYNRGKVSSDFSGGAIVGTTDIGITIENCYYLETADGATDENSGVTKKTADEMKSDDFLALLDNGQNVWDKDNNVINEGFPVLAWQNDITSSISQTIVTDKPGIIIDGRNISIPTTKSCKVTVTDIGGRIVTTKTLNGGTLLIPESGAYIINVSGNGISGSYKVVVR